MPFPYVLPLAKNLKRPVHADFRDGGVFHPFLGKFKVVIDRGGPVNGSDVFVAVIALRHRKHSKSPNRGQRKY
ncbi:MAG: hypothetical protein ACTS8S_22775, partial [Giesbergeria sp.]